MKNFTKNPQQTLRLLQVDIAIQWLIIICSFLILAFPIESYYFFIGIYLVLGGWQVLSFLVHLKRRLKTSKIGLNYGKLLLALLIIGAPIIVAPFFRFPDFVYSIWFLGAFVLLFLGPAMALWYIGISYQDKTQILKAMDSEKEAKNLKENQASVSTSSTNND